MRLVYIAILLGLTFQVRALSLKGYLERLLEDHPLLKAETLDVNIQQSLLEGIRGAEDTFWSMGAEYGYSEPLSNSLFAPDSVERVSASLGVRRPIWDSGGVLSTGYRFERSEEDAAMVAFPGQAMDEEAGGFVSSLPLFYQQQVYLSYVQPLLKNWRGKQDRISALQQEWVLAQSRLQAEETREAYLSNQARLYIDGVLNSALEKVAKKRQVLAQETLAYLSEQADVNLVDEVEVFRAEESLRSVEQLWEQLNMASKTVWQQIQVQLNTNTLTVTESTSKLPNTFTLPAEPVWDELRSIAALRALQNQFDALSVAYSNATLPELNLVLQGALGSGGEDLDGASEFDQPEAGIGLEVVIPWGNDTALAQEKQNRLLAQQAALRTEQTLRDLKAAWFAGVTQFKQTQKLLDTLEKQGLAAQNRLTQEQKLYEQGRGSLVFVLSSQDNVVAIEATRLEYLASLWKIQLDLMALSDALLVDGEIGYDVVK